MQQNIIVILWDFDRTLIPGFMQTPLFKHYGIDELEFWSDLKKSESTAMTKEQIRRSPEFAYLNKILRYVRDGTFAGLNNRMLRELGGLIRFFPGVKDCMRSLKKLLSEDAKYQQFDIRLEHYVISAGLRQMILGSEICSEIDDVWGCELGETDGVLSHISYVIDDTTKTRAVFEINKGVNKFPEDIKINAFMPNEKRRVPIEQMIYVADGPSDVPVFSLLNKHDAPTLGVYNPHSKEAYEKAYRLHMNEGRTDHFGKADYAEGSDVRLWLERTVRGLANDVHARLAKQVKDSVGESPAH